MMVRTVSFKVEDDLYYMLVVLARRRLPVSEIIRRAIRQYIRGQPDRPFVTRRMRIYT